MSLLPSLPILCPLIAAVMVLFYWHKPFVQKWITLIAMLIIIVINIVLIHQVFHQSFVVTQIGLWPAPFGITLVADMLSSMMTLTTSIIAFCVSIYSFVDIGKSRSKRGFYPAFCVLIAGLSGAFLTGDIFNLYVWFEVVLISSFVLLALEDSKIKLEGAVKYAVLNLVATLILLTAIAFLYGISGTLNLADLASYITLSQNLGLITTISVIFIIAFGMKAAMFPLFFWLPASYHTTSFSTSALFSGLLSKLGVYALLRVFTLVFLKNPNYLHVLILLAANFTLLMGIIGAIAQIEFRRILSFTLISHIGYMIIGLSLLTPLALIGSIFYIIQHMLIKTNLFLGSGYIQANTGCSDMIVTKNLYRRYPYFSIMFFISLAALAGIPPLSGFWAKIMLLQATFVDYSYVTLAILLIASFLTIYVGVRMWQNAFLCTSKEVIKSKPILPHEQRLLFLPMCIITLLILVISLFPVVLLNLCQIAAHELLQPSLYIHAVLGRGFT